MLKLAIVGYGNLGKSLQAQIQNQANMQLAAVYSRRNILHPLARPMKELGKQKDFDIALIALGSYADVQAFAQPLAHINTVDSFDTHAAIPQYKKTLNALKRDCLAVISAGWDPGVLSLARATWGIGAKSVATLWGEGVSQGHSNALRMIPGVLDAVQFTVPKEDALRLVAQGVTDGRQLHRRICYVACVEEDKPRVEREIRAMPNYFEGYETEVNFVSQQEVRQQKLRTHHRGQTIALGEGFEANSVVTMDCNADYTAKIMLAYARALPQLFADGYRGAVDVLDVPLRYLADKSVL